MKNQKEVYEALLAGKRLSHINLVYRDEIEISKIAAILLSGYCSNPLIDSRLTVPSIDDVVLEAYEIIKSTKNLLDTINKPEAIYKSEE